MQAWRGWLYSGGSATVCATPAQHAAALVTSLDPSIVKRQNTGTDSEELQRLQHDLLQACAALCSGVGLCHICTRCSLEGIAVTSRFFLGDRPSVRLQVIHREVPAALYPAAACALADLQEVMLGGT